MKGDSAPGKNGITINIIKHIKESISDSSVRRILVITNNN